jgi:hypothetical protein
MFPEPDWTRNDSILLGETAMKPGLNTHNSREALMIGARMIAHRFSGYGIDQMIKIITATH